MVQQVLTGTYEVNRNIGSRVRSVVSRVAKEGVMQGPAVSLWRKPEKVDRAGEGGVR
jgi:hypothetical protein